MCGRDKVAFIQRDMTMEFFRGLFDSNAPPEAIWPYGFGEPMLHPQLFEFIRFAKSRGSVVSMSTNGTLLNEPGARKLLRSGLDYLIIAFDGATPATYSQYRRGASFDGVLGRVDRFLELKREEGSRLHVTLQMIRMRLNNGEIGLFKRMWRRPGVDRIRIREDLSERHKKAGGRLRPCFFLWRGPLFIQAAGTVIPCPYYHGAEPFGDLNVQPIEEVWNSPRFSRLRQAHVDGEMSEFPVCAACPRYQPHPVIAAASFFVTTRLVRRLLPIVEEVQRRLHLTLFE